MYIVHITYHKLYEVDVAITVGVIHPIETYSSCQDMLIHLKVDGNEKWGGSGRT
jgi:hypothetical protein